MNTPNKTVVIAGITGAMGQQAAELIGTLPDFTLVGGFAPHATPQAKPNLLITNKIEELPPADIWIDFTVPSVVFKNIRYAISHGYHPVVGTTGLTAQEVLELQEMALHDHRGGLIAPNFGLSAVLLMKFAKEAAQYFPDVEIIEMHHPGKKDAPSGTAIATANVINANRDPSSPSNSTETIAGVRGGQVNGIPIHSVRLPGYVAHEQVLFGAPGEALTIRQDSFDRKSFMAGVKLACQKVTTLQSLVVGLENILD